MMMNIKATLTALCLAASVAATPVSLAPRFETAKCPTGKGTTRVNVTESFNLWPNQPNKYSEMVGGFEVETRKGEPMLEHLAVFKGVPKEAKKCLLGWAQGDRTNRVFVASGSALMNVHPLAEQAPTADGISYNSVIPLVDNDAPRLRPDFTSWDQVDKGQGHIAGEIDCNTELSFKISLDKNAEKSHVYLQNDEASGFYVEFSC